MSAQSMPWQARGDLWPLQKHESLLRRLPGGVRLRHRAAAASQSGGPLDAPVPTPAGFCNPFFWVFHIIKFYPPFPLAPSDDEAAQQAEAEAAAAAPAGFGAGRASALDVAQGRPVLPGPLLLQHLQLRQADAELPAHRQHLLLGQLPGIYTAASATAASAWPTAQMYTA